MSHSAKLTYTLRIGDNCLILGQRLGEWCGHGPVLEQDIAITNIALDMVGQSRLWLSYVAELEHQGRDEDQVAFLRKPNDYYHLLLVEQPNTDFAYTIVRQFLFDSFNYFFHEQLLESTDERYRAIAEKSMKEITYHLRYSSEWMIRLGDGTEESHAKMQRALDDLWMYSGEALEADAIDQAAAAEGYGVTLSKIANAVEGKRLDIIRQATLTTPEDNWMQSGGKVGRHTEHLGYILAEMQYMQRAYPNMQW